MRLRDLHVCARVGIACLVLVILGGTTAAGVYMAMHHANRDERPGLTIDDIRAHYRGVVSRAPLLVALESGHPDEIEPDDLDPADRDALLGWLRSNRVPQMYDDLDLGDRAPAEIIAVSCLDCHARSASGENAAPDMPLETWPDVEPLSVSRDIKPVPTEVLAASTHTHALGIGSMVAVMCLLGLVTSWPRRLTGALVFLAGFGLLADLASWWLARFADPFIYVIVGGGFVFNAAVIVLGLLVLIDLVLPRKARPPATEA